MAAEPRCAGCGERVRGTEPPLAAARCEACTCGGAGADAPTIPWEPPLCTWSADDPAPSFYDPLATYPFLRHLQAAHGELLAELDAAGPGARAWHDWPETALYMPEHGHEWRVVPFCYTFPADDPSQTQWVGSSCAALPVIASWLRRLPGVRTALLSQLGPGTSLASHQGWAQLSNHVLRVHLGLRLPPPPAAAQGAAAADGEAGAARVDPTGEGEGEGLGEGRSAELAGAPRPGPAAGSSASASSGSAPGYSGLMVDDEIRYHAAGQLLCFDDSRVHSAFNNHPTASRVVLIIDLPRPHGAPPGIATGGTTEELASFMQFFN